ncbi:MAG: AMP-binding protein [Acidimicrobiia bacterium]|nr:AMP-binding protein [Acidimicrobiia bacterium]
MTTRRAPPLAGRGWLLAWLGRRGTGEADSQVALDAGEAPTTQPGIVSAPPVFQHQRPCEVAVRTIIHTSPLPDVEISDQSITECVFASVADHADEVAITDGTSSYTFSELHDLVRSLGGGLSSRGVGPGTTVAILAPNVPEYAVVFHGIALAGGTITTINPTYSAEEVRFQLTDASASWLVTIPMFLETARAAAAGTAVEHILVMGEAEGATTLTSLFGKRIDQVPVDYAEHVVVLPYSSGTTGLPKGVMLTHRNLVANIAQMEHTFTPAAGEVALAVLPFFHIYGMQVLMNMLLAFGVRVVTMPRFDMVRALELVQEQRITRFFAVPPMVLGLAKHPAVDDFDLSSIKQIFSGAAPLGADLAAAAATRVGCEVVQGYGMTELSPVSHCTPEGQFRPGTSGVTISNTEIRIVDPESGADLDVGGRGELLVRGPQVMKGYLNNPDATAETLDSDGWLYTGDVAVIDDEDHVSIVDRIKELIKYKAWQVAPAELEAVLVTHPAVADAAVIGIPDEEAGELPKAFITLAPGADAPTLAELQSHVGEHLASYKQVRSFEVLEAIPKSASGKILRRELRDR